jgi:hypothetical protein
MKNSPVIFSHSRRCICWGGISLLFISACESKPMTVNLDVVLFSYIDRPVFEVFINGDAGSSSRGMPAVGGGTIAGVSIPLGPQKVTWTLDGPEGMARNGEKVNAKNSLELKDVPQNHRYLAIHIYPDDTVELITTVHYPRPSERGEIEITKWEAKNGK